MTFFGRQQELSRLQHFYNSRIDNLALVYGRRRVGKSELIKHSLRLNQINAIYYECKQTTEKGNVQSLSRLIAESLGIPSLSFDTLEDLLGFLFTQSKEPLVLVLDEYPYLRDLIKGCDSQIQALVDRHKDASRLQIVLCGSYIDTMKSLLEYRNPLYGRCGLVLQLKPMDYYESSMFYPNFTNEDKVRLFSVFGGIPYYNRLIDQTKSVKENILDLIASPDARLDNEISMFLRSELGKISNANAVFEVLAQGFSKFSDILAQSHVSTGALLADILNRLIQMGLVEKSAPINDENNKKKTAYRICDNLSLFYYRYIYRNLSHRQMMPSTAFYSRFIAEDFETQFVPKRFEDICKEFLIRRNQQEKIDPLFFRIGRYYFDIPKEKRNGEFDVVTEDEHGFTCYEAKFKNTALTQSDIDQEIEQVQSSPLNAYRYGFISKSGYTNVASDGKLTLLTLDDLYSF